MRFRCLINVNNYKLLHHTTGFAFPLQYCKTVAKIQGSFSRNFSFCSNVIVPCKPGVFSVNSTSRIAAIW